MSDMRKAPIKPFQCTPRTPAMAGCDGHKMVLLTPDMLQGPGGTLSATLSLQRKVTFLTAKEVLSPLQSDKT